MGANTVDEKVRKIVAEELGKLKPKEEAMPTEEVIGPLKSSAVMAEDFAKLNDAIAKMEEARANLEAELDRLKSEEHSHEIIANFFNQDWDSVAPEKKVEFGIKLGLDTLFREAEVAEGGEVPTGDKEPEKPQSELEAIMAFLAKQEG